MTLLLVVPLQPIAPAPSARPAVTQVLGAVWVPGLGLALSSVGFGTIATFGALIFAVRGWSSSWLVFTLLSIAFIVGRVVFGHLPDRIGGARVALVCLLIEAAGQAMIWLAQSSALVFVGAAVTGLGYSLVYPGFGAEAVRRAPPQGRGLTMGAYTAFLDLALGIASPALGLIASGAGLVSVFLVSTLTVLGAAAIAIRLIPARDSADAAFGSGGVPIHNQPAALRPAMLDSCD